MKRRKYPPKWKIKGKNATQRHHSQESGPGETPLISPGTVAGKVGMRDADGGNKEWVMGKWVGMGTARFLF